MTNNVPKGSMLMLMLFGVTPMSHGLASMAESMRELTFGGDGNARLTAHSPPLARSGAGGATSKPALVRRQASVGETLNMAVCAACIAYEARGKTPVACASESGSATSGAAVRNTPAAKGSRVGFGN